MFLHRFAELISKTCLSLLTIATISLAGCGTPTAQEADVAHPHGGESVELSEAAQQSIGLLKGAVERSDYDVTITVPGIIVDRPGRTARHVPAPLAGVVQRVHRTQGEAVKPGEPLFYLHLMHEELVEAQGDYLRLIEEQKVMASEVKRLEGVARQGVIAGKKLLEKQNELAKTTAQLNAQRERLLLHGLGRDDLTQIEKQQKLVHGVRVVAPSRNMEHVHEMDEAQSAADGRRLQIRKLNVEAGQHVAAGDSLCELVDYSELYIEGQAFSPDVPYLLDVIQNSGSVTAVFGSSSEGRKTLENLKIVYVDNSVNPLTRLHSFFVALTNEKLGSHDDDSRFLQWRFRPGQRVKLEIPIARLEERIVLPVDAVAQDGLESYVFVENGDIFERKAVRVERRDTDKQQVVLAKGALYDGTVIAMNSADLLNLELKNQRSGGADPHAGHGH